MRVQILVSRSLAPGATTGARSTVTEQGAAVAPRLEYEKAMKTWSGSCGAAKGAGGAILWGQGPHADADGVNAKVRREEVVS